MQPLKKGNAYHFHSIILRTISSTYSRKCIKGKRKSGEVAEPDKPAHRQLGVQPHHVWDYSKVLAEYRIKDIEKFHFAVNADFQNQFKNAYDHDQDYIHGEAHKQLKTCFWFWFGYCLTSQ